MYSTSTVSKATSKRHVDAQTGGRKFLKGKVGKLIDSHQKGACSVFIVCMDDGDIVLEDSEPFRLFLRIVDIVLVVGF